MLSLHAATKAAAKFTLRLLLLLFTNAVSHLFTKNERIFHGFTHFHSEYFAVSHIFWANFGEVFTFSVKPSQKARFAAALKAACDKIRRVFCVHKSFTFLFKLFTTNSYWIYLPVVSYRQWNTRDTPLECFSENVFVFIPISLFKYTPTKHNAFPQGKVLCFS